MKPVYDYTELSKQQLREQIKYDTERYFKRGGKIRFYDQADNLVSEYVEVRDEEQSERHSNRATYREDRGRWAQLDGSVPEGNW